jgi:hypothetical protein
MKVTINANSVNQILNADVINMDQVRGLTPQEKSELVQKLAETLSRQSQQLLATEEGVPREKVQCMAEAVNSAAAAVTFNQGDSGSKKIHIGTILGGIKDSLGGVADILLNAVKLAQVIGILN